MLRIRRCLTVSYYDHAISSAKYAHTMCTIYHEYVPCRYSCASMTIERNDPNYDLIISLIIKERKRISLDRHDKLDAFSLRYIPSMFRFKHTEGSRYENSKKSISHVIQPMSNVE